MTFKEILKDKRVTDEMMACIIDAMDEYAYENECLKEKISYIVNDFHESEYTAWRKIHAMVPVAYIGHGGELLHGVDSMADYLSTLGITPELSNKKVDEAYHIAKDKGSSKGITAPMLHSNMWDAFVSMAMIFSDYWYTVCGDIDKAAMIAYEYLSDPDKKK